MPVRPQRHKPSRTSTPRYQAVAVAPPATRWGSGRGGRPWRRKRERVFARDKYLCQIHLGQGHMVPVTLSGPRAGVCDHVVPEAEGGTDEESNLQTICQACSKAKTAIESARGRAR